MTFLLSFFFIFQSWVFSAPNGDLTVPFLSGPVVDRAQFLNPSEINAVTEQLSHLNASQKIQMAVLIVPTLGDKTIEGYALEIAEKWKLGEKNKDQGAIFLIAPNERKMRIEVGYGLEGDLPDAYLKNLLDTKVSRYFKVKQFGDGILIAIEEIAKQIGVDLKVPISRRLENKPLPLSKGLLFLLALIVLFLIVFRSVFQQNSYWYHQRGRDDFWGGGGGFGGGFGGGGSSGGGGFSGGGGSFGGGGASSDW